MEVFYFLAHASGLSCGLWVLKAVSLMLSHGQAQYSYRMPHVGRHSLTTGLNPPSVLEGRFITTGPSKEVPGPDLDKFYKPY